MRSNNRRLADLEAITPQFTEAQKQHAWDELARAIGLPIPPSVPRSVIRELANLTYASLRTTPPDLQPVADSVAAIKKRYGEST